MAGIPTGAIDLRASFRADRSDWMPTYLVRGRTPCVEAGPQVDDINAFMSAHGQQGGDSGWEVGMQVCCSF
jgi:hypothetical protein